MDDCKKCTTLRADNAKLVELLREAPPTSFAANKKPETRYAAIVEDFRGQYVDWRSRVYAILAQSSATAEVRPGERKHACDECGLIHDRDGNIERWTAEDIAAAQEAAKRYAPLFADERAGVEQQSNPEDAAGGAGSIPGRALLVADPAKASGDDDLGTSQKGPDSTPAKPSPEVRPSDEDVGCVIDTLVVDEHPTDADVVRRLLAYTKRLESDLEYERLRLAGCSAEALGYNDGFGPENKYWSASAEDVRGLRDRWLKERERAEAGEKRVAELEAQQRRDEEVIEQNIMQMNRDADRIAAAEAEEMERALAKTESARAQAQEWLDRFQGFVGDRDLEIMKLRGQLAASGQTMKPGEAK